jgi:hypothetical protein
MRAAKGLPMSSNLITMKVQGLYLAFAPEAGVYCYGGCLEEAVNSLTDELRSERAGTKQGAGEERT